MNLTWAAGDPSDTVEVMILRGNTVSDDNPDGSTTVAAHSVMVHCIFPDTGSGTVSADRLARIPADTPAVTLMIQRTRQARIDVPLKSAGGTGKVNVSGETGVMRSFPVQ